MRRPVFVELPLLQLLCSSVSGCWDTARLGSGCAGEVMSCARTAWEATARPRTIAVIVRFSIFNLRSMLDKGVRHCEREIECALALAGEQLHARTNPRAPRSDADRSMSYRFVIVQQFARQRKAVTSASRVGRARCAGDDGKRVDEQHVGNPHHRRQRVLIAPSHDAPAQLQPVARGELQRRYSALMPAALTTAAQRSLSLRR